jgi:hypothetical protein
MKPLPYLVGFGLFALAVFCAVRAWRSLAQLSRLHRGLIFGAALLLGLLLALSLFGHTYEANEEWKYVGWPMMIYGLRRVVLPDGRVVWHDYLGVLMPFALVANFVFLLLAPTLPLAAWSYISRWRGTPTPNHTSEVVRQGFG